MDKPLFELLDIAEVDDVMSSFHRQKVVITSIEYDAARKRFRYSYTPDSGYSYTILNTYCFKKVGKYDN
jgi:hypothetical protein